MIDDVVPAELRDEMWQLVREVRALEPVLAELGKRAADLEAEYSRLLQAGYLGDDDGWERYREAGDAFTGYQLLRETFMDVGEKFTGWTGNGPD